MAGREIKICVVGWYWREGFLEQLRQVNATYPVIIVSHGNRPMKDVGLVVVEKPNVGLEFGAYDRYIKEEWDGRSDVLFMHDDSAVSSPEFFDKVAQAKIDQTFIFSTKEEGKNNQHFHGRAFKCSARFLHAMLEYKCECRQASKYIDYHHNKYCSEKCFRETVKDREPIIAKIDVTMNNSCSTCRKPIEGDTFYGTMLDGTGPHTGFWYDPNNYGHNRGKPPAGVRHYNDAIYHFSLFAKHAHNPGINDIKYDSGGCIYIPELTTGKRGKV